MARKASADTESTHGFNDIIGIVLLGFAVLYLIPMMFMGFRSDGTALLIVPGFVLIGSMLAGNLAWLTIAAEDAPELIGTAPAPAA